MKSYKSTAVSSLFVVTLSCLLALNQTAFGSCPVGCPEAPCSEITEGGPIQVQTSDRVVCLMPAAANPEGSENWDAAQWAQFAAFQVTATDQDLRTNYWYSQGGDCSCTLQTWEVILQNGGGINITWELVDGAPDLTVWNSFYRFRAIVANAPVEYEIHGALCEGEPYPRWFYEHTSVDFLLRVGLYPGDDDWDYCDSTEQSDGIPNACDNCPDHCNPDQADGDWDGAGDVCDNCLSTFNPEQADTDSGGGDGVGDACDNCPSIQNAGQTDADLDGIGDVCQDVDLDVDSDNDNGGNLPDRSPAEDQIENDTSLPGKILHVNNDDDDGDQISDKDQSFAIPGEDDLVSATLAFRNIAPPLTTINYILIFDNSIRLWRSPERGDLNGGGQDLILSGARQAHQLWVLGDMTGDGALNQSDLAAFDLAISNPSGYASSYPDVDPATAGDMNVDGTLDSIDRGLLEDRIATQKIEFAPVRFWIEGIASGLSMPNTQIKATWDANDDGYANLDEGCQRRSETVANRPV